MKQSKQMTPVRAVSVVSNLRDIFVISDTHFLHGNIIEYCNRPFSGVEDMTEHMVDRWNSVVLDRDIVYHLGDVYMGRQDEANRILSRLRGRKRLILGNHDIGKDPVLRQHFQKISAWRMFPEYSLILTHWPVHPYMFNEKIRTNVHGHIHNNRTPGIDEDRRYINVSVENVNYTPVNIEELSKQ